jgi:hypothetical protein
MTRKAQKLARVAAVVAVMAAFALPCAGWGWDGAANSGSPDDAPAAAQAG